MGNKEKINNTAIVCGGEINDLQWLSQKLIDYDFIISADSGYDWCLKCGVKPNIIIGDMDSVKYDVDASIKIIKFPVKKDKTDFSLCLDYLIENGIKNADVFGALGGRIDHTLGAILSILEVKNQGFNAVIKSENSDLFIVSDSKKLNKSDGYVSVFALGGDALGVTLEGFEYPLEDYNLKCSSPLGISNHIVSDIAKISVKSGKLLVIIQK